MKHNILAAAVVAALFQPAISFESNAAGFKPAPAAGQLGAVLVNPYGNSPLTAVLDLGSKRPTDVTVTVHGKGKKGVDISYPVGQQTINTHDGIPLFGLYADHSNQVSVKFKLDGKTIKEDYKVLTGPITNEYMDNRNITVMQEVQVKKVAKGFENRLYMVNSHTYNQQGSDLHWSGQKSKDAGIFESTPALGSMTFDNAPMTYVIDTNGDIRWWLDQDAVYDGVGIDANKRGYLMGLHDNGEGRITFVQGQQYGTFDLLGNFDSRRLPRGYIDASHEHNLMPNGHSLVRAAKANYKNPQGDIVHTVRDHILQIDQQGNLVDVWNLNEIMDPYRDALLEALDMGAVCLNVDIDQMGQTAEMEIDAPYGDIPGIAAGRNWAHINSIEYDPKDDSIILSFRHQGVAKVTRDKEVKWILAPYEGWNKELSKKLLKPVDKNGKPIKCTEKGVCDGDFDFTYTQHTAWLNNTTGNLTVLDNGDGRAHEQPALPTMKYTRFVEYKIDDENMTVQQTWEYGKDRGYDWYSPITSNVEYMEDKNTMFGFGGSIHLYTPGERTVGKINEIGYDDMKVKVEIDVLSDKANSPHYRAIIVNPTSQFGL
ncbi:aryl-sulfate sulfotransferase [Shewanella sp. D64]|uniref:aryl-sulfate sulfotransferase n=1 Tax=unclassified Shewanella TaxID=196818 RepID=UPI0022BA2640|nr:MULTISPECIES: aryl-sulfate sulfotransferase [unclassified Shewanella]MEC4728433.1 aryl-sulfate sulfotransferase [Shewanella sp. D64]MEC4740200.1 aryl-sulfate sulfotransferase [Shewanella sp. E94]WBJ96270.1 aryl-sulfate sulfotransferase [Shewanella sp. MTB7]